MSDVTTPLNKLAIVLLVVSGIGVIGAGAAGLWVARTGLRPVDQLTGTVEHVARTEDLTVRIPVEGEDEIARLSRSFNAMTAAHCSAVTGITDSREPFCTSGISASAVCCFR